MSRITVKELVDEVEINRPEFMEEMTYQMVVNSVNVFKDVSCGELQEQEERRAY